MASDSEIQKLSENVSSLQRDMSQVGLLVDRLDVTIERLTEVSTTVSQLLAVQGNRLEFQERASNKLEEMIEKRKSDTDASIKEVVQKVEKVEEDLHDELHNNHKQVIDEIKSLKTESAKQHSDFNNRMTSLEKWMWTLVGGSVVAGFLLNNLDIFTNLAG